MRTLLLALLIVLLGIGTSVATFLWGGKVARARIQEAMTQILEASQAAKAIKSPEQDILQDPPDVQPAGNERQTELSLAALEAMRETAEPGSLRFDNPDVVNLLNQLRSRQEYQDSREKRLKELEERIRLEMQCCCNNFSQDFSSNKHFGIVSPLSGKVFFSKYMLTSSDITSGYVTRRKTSLL